MGLELDLELLQRYRQSTLARNAAWMLLGQGLSFFCQAVYFILVARLLGSRDYGIVVGAFAFASLVSQYSSLGTGTLLLRYVSIDRSDFAAYWGNVLLTTSIMSGLLGVVMCYLGWRILNPASARLVPLAVVAGCLCAQLTAEIARIFQCFEKMRVTAMINLSTNAFRTCAVGVMLLTLHRATAWQWAVVSTLVSAGAAVAAVIAVLVNFGAPTFQPRLLWQRAIEGLGFSFAASTSSLYNDLDKTMLSHYGMNVANGIYTMAYRVVDFATMPVIALKDAALPKFFQRGRDGFAQGAELAQRMMKKAVPLSLGIAVILIVTAPVIPHMVGRGFAESVVALRWLALIPVFRSVHQMTGSALTGAGFQNQRTAAQVVAAGMNFLLNLWLIPAHGWRGAAWASLVTDAALALMNWFILRIMVARAQNQGISLPAQA